MFLSEGRHNSAFWRRTVPKLLQYDFLLPDIVIVEIIAGLLRAREARVGQSPILIAELPRALRARVAEHHG